MIFWFFYRLITLTAYSNNKVRIAFYITFSYHFSFFFLKISALNGSTVGFGLLTLLISVTFRIITTYFCVIGGNLNIKERLFVALSWLPKATIQVKQSQQNTSNIMQWAIMRYKWHQNAVYITFVIFFRLPLDLQRLTWLGQLMKRPKLNLLKRL